MDIIEKIKDFPFADAHDETVATLAFGLGRDSCAVEFEIIDLKALVTRLEEALAVVDNVAECGTLAMCTVCQNQALAFRRKYPKEPK
jgi:hypothetical protein